MGMLDSAINLLNEHQKQKQFDAVAGAMVNDFKSAFFFEQNNRGLGIELMYAIYGAGYESMLNNNVSAPFINSELTEISVAFKGDWLNHERLYHVIKRISDIDFGVFGYRLIDAAVDSSDTFLSVSFATYLMNEQEVRKRYKGFRANKKRLYQELQE